MDDRSFDSRRRSTWAGLWRHVRRWPIALLGLAVVKLANGLPPPQPQPPLYVVWDAIAVGSGEVVVAHTLGVFRGRPGQPWRHELAERLQGARLFSGGGALWLQQEGKVGLIRLEAGRWHRVDDPNATDSEARMPTLLGIDKKARLWACWPGGRLKRSTDAIKWVAVAPPTAGAPCTQALTIAQGASVITVQFGTDLFQTADGGRRWTAIPQDEVMASAGHRPSSTAATGNGRVLNYSILFLRETVGVADVLLRQWTPGANAWRTVPGASEPDWVDWREPIWVAGDRVFLRRRGRHHHISHIAELTAEGALATVLPASTCWGSVLCKYFTDGDALFAVTHKEVSRFNPALGRFETWAPLPDPYTGR